MNGRSPKSATSPAAVAGRSPLLVGHPLQVLPIADLGAQPARAASSASGSRSRSGAGHSVHGRRRARDAARERARRCRATIASRATKARSAARAACRRAARRPRSARSARRSACSLSARTCAVIDPRRGANRPELSAIGDSSAPSPPSALEVRQHGERDEPRIDGHAAQRRVRRRLVVRQLVDRQQLRHALSGRRAASAASRPDRRSRRCPSRACDRSEKSGSIRPARGPAHHDGVARVTQHPFERVAKRVRPAAAG